jgi:hypothetical protein
LAKALELGAALRSRRSVGPLLWLKMPATVQRPLRADRAGSTVCRCFRPAPISRHQQTRPATNQSIVRAMFAGLNTGALRSRLTAPENSETILKSLMDNKRRFRSFSEPCLEIYGETSLLCRPLRNHSATWPHARGSIQALNGLGNYPRLAIAKVLKLYSGRISETAVPDLFRWVTSTGFKLRSAAALPIFQQHGLRPENHPWRGAVHRCPPPPGVLSRPPLLALGHHPGRLLGR